MFDGNGNVAGLVSAANASVTATYEYAPFGGLLRAEGAMAEANSFCFSTKLLDPELGFYYYGYRYYDPATGRWLNRDPIGERGGENVYGVVKNAPISRTDIFGMEDYENLVGICPICTAEAGINGIKAKWKKYKSLSEEEQEWAKTHIACALAARNSDALAKNAVSNYFGGASIAQRDVINAALHLDVLCLLIDMLYEY